ncbi:kinesin-like protein KIF17 [Gouania willdenowi]|uniref:kinesin-like protein KIF17 n=1 Tax=Gouania willdenowi TaxID=441366 RepID=UPI0010565DB0|nr:kinesin-like protein KIF17 [Gouania willdenowi]
MTTVKMNPVMCQGVETVKVGVVLTTPTGEAQTKCVCEAVDGQCAVICEGGYRLDYTAGKDEGIKSFSFDYAAVVDDIEILYQKLLQPLTEFISTGYNVALLLCGASSEPISSLTDHSLIRQLLRSLFSCVKSQEKEELFTSVSCLQFHPDDIEVDVLSLNKQPLQLVKHPALGCIVAGLCEVSVCSAEEAYTVYETCWKTMKNPAGCIYRWNSLFSINVERKLNPPEPESVVCRSTLQLFNLAGGASRADLTGVNPLVKLLDQKPKPAGTSCLNLHQSLLKEALTGNSKTVLIYCIDPQDDETLCALELTQRVRALTTKASVGRWSPGVAEREIRDRIRDLRSEMMSQGGDENFVYRLSELTQYLQIVKNHSWEKRREESEKIKDKMKNLTSVNGNQQFSEGPHKDQSETDTIRYLQDQLRQEMEEHIKEGKGNVEKVRAGSENPAAEGDSEGGDAEEWGVHGDVSSLSTATAGLQPSTGAKKATEGGSWEITAGGGGEDGERLGTRAAPNGGCSQGAAAAQQGKAGSGSAD